MIYRNVLAHYICVLYDFKMNMILYNFKISKFVDNIERIHIEHTHTHIQCNLIIIIYIVIYNLRSLNKMHVTVEKAIYICPQVYSNIYIIFVK